MIQLWEDTAHTEVVMDGRASKKIRQRAISQRFGEPFDERWKAASQAVLPSEVRVGDDETINEGA